MRLPVIGDDQGKIDEAEAARMLHYAIEQGVNYVDTAWPYHDGASEPFVGRALKGGWREKVYLATKLPTWLTKTRADCDKYLNEQLRRMRTDSIDFYLLHGLDGDSWRKMLEMDALGFLDAALRDGRIGHAGFSFHGELEDFKLIVDGYGWTFCQIQYNYMDENFQAGTEGLKYAASKGLAVIAMEPLRGGKLTKNAPEGVRSLLAKGGIDRSPAELGLRWVWNHPEISCVLSGMSAMEQVVENCRVADDARPDSLSAEELAVIGKIRDLYLGRTKVACTDCGYCLPCPEGVNIPAILSIYNEMFLYDDINCARDDYRMALKQGERASNCTECAQCEEACPQRIEIIETLKKCTEALE